MSSHQPKKPEKLAAETFTGDPMDTQRFVHDVEIKLDYFCDSLVKEIDKVSLVLPLLRDTAKEWYKAIHPDINKDAAITGAHYREVNSKVATAPNSK